MNRGWGGLGSGVDVVQTPYFRKKEKRKRKKSILRRFKAMKNFGWYSLSSLVQKFVRTLVKYLKLNFMVVCVGVKVQNWQNSLFFWLKFGIWCIKLLLLWC